MSFFANLVGAGLKVQPEVNTVDNNSVGKFKVKDGELPVKLGTKSETSSSFALTESIINGIDLKNLVFVNREVDVEKEKIISPENIGDQLKTMVADVEKQKNLNEQVKINLEKKQQELDQKQIGLDKAIEALNLKENEYTSKVQTGIDAQKRNEPQARALNSIIDGLHLLVPAYLNIAKGSPEAQVKFVNLCKHEMNVAFLNRVDGDRLGALKEGVVKTWEEAMNKALQEAKFNDDQTKAFLALLKAAITEVKEETVVLKSKLDKLRDLLYNAKLPALVIAAYALGQSDEWICSILPDLISNILFLAKDFIGDIAVPGLIMAFGYLLHLAAQYSIALKESLRPTAPEVKAQYLHNSMLAAIKG